MPFSYSPHKSSFFDANANTVAWISYILVFAIGLFPFIRYFAWLAPLLMYLLERDSGLVKYHSMQAFVLGVAYSIVKFVLDIIGWIFAIPGYLSNNFFASFSSALLSFPLKIASLAVWVFFIVITIKSIMSAYRYQEYSIPVVSNLADRLKALFKK